jgi:hypothetical protein
MAPVFLAVGLVLLVVAVVMQLWLTAAGVALAVLSVGMGVLADNRRPKDELERREPTHPIVVRAVAAPQAPVPPHP